ncbi:hypothetical protein H2199_008028 [Coniosporium tulheliwenetii]|uniref:Uncharacterized protein n=1 Tax=Coniosporium tulheliwenetii TaxID=3383036 RepID=A0ACC2YLY1_9PEZI|nr:hypothetical protein H2199_008028 [Cladosporium sp. JES 115]
MSSGLNIKKIAMIGCGSMGGGMALLFAENGIEVSLQDPSVEAMDLIIETAKKDEIPAERLKKYTDYESLCASLDSPKVFFFSLPHGSVGDTVLDGLTPYLKKNDIIIDAGNEHFTNTERRQGKCATRGIRYVGMGVSGGYQAARQGPSMCPGGDDSTLDQVMPLLEMAAAKDEKGRPCVGKAGTGAWQIMNVGLGMNYEDIGGVFGEWNKDGPLRNTFLISIGALICRTHSSDYTHEEKGKKDDHVLALVQDKVVQDITGEEGTGIWSNTEAVTEHVPAPTLTEAHYLRLASSNRDARIKAREVMKADFDPQPLNLEGEEKDKFIKDLRTATYLACLCSYIQGINIIEQADKHNMWNIDYAAVLQIWAAGCIIQADYIAELLRPEFNDYQNQKSMKLLFNETVAKEIKDGVPSLRRVCARGTESDHVILALSATLEYIKFMTNTSLPTPFYEAELDFFGGHMFDIKGEAGTGGPTEGKHHYEWRPA